MMVKGFKDTIKWYDENALSYTKSCKGREYINEINYFSSLLKNKDLILDAGCGGGRDCNIFFNQDFKVIGVDISDNLIKYCQKNYPQIKFFKADFRKLPFNNNYFDGVWAHASLVHFESIKDVKKSLSEFYRVLKKDGILYICVKEIVRKKFDVISDSLSKHLRFFQFFSTNELKKLIQFQGLKILKTYLYQGSRNTWIITFSKK